MEGYIFPLDSKRGEEGDVGKEIGGKKLLNIFCKVNTPTMKRF